MGRNGGWKDRQRGGNRIGAMLENIFFKHLVIWDLLAISVTKSRLAAGLY